MSKSVPTKKKVAIKRKNFLQANKGFSGFFVIAAVVFAVFLAGAFSSVATQNPIQAILSNNPNTIEKKTLQLRTLDFITVTPAPTGTPSTPVTTSPVNINCQQNQDTEKEILIGSDPAPGGTLQSTGKIRVWVNDEGAPHIAPGEQVDPTNGQITKPGDRTAKDTGTDGNGKYLWEPAIYLTSVTTANSSGPFTGDAENGGTPYFPSIIKGDYNNYTNTKSGGSKGPPIDSDYTNFENGPAYINNSVGTHLPEKYTAEYIWDLTTLNLTPGTYHVEEIIHDGDDNIAINCVAFQL